MQTSFHHQPEAQHPNFPLSTSWQADYPIFGLHFADSSRTSRHVRLVPIVLQKSFCSGDQKFSGL